MKNKGSKRLSIPLRISCIENGRFEKLSAWKLEIQIVWAGLF